MRMVRRATGEARAALAADLKVVYESGLSIRKIAAGTGYSYGTVHNLLNEAGTVMRGSGGDNRG